ncbi:MAG TPA: M20 family metallopeptidase [Firmicutes bacterium]|nr:M20 family metallopeptidase [Bacillota bacterium]
MKDSLLSYVRQHLSDFLGGLQELVELESPSDDRVLVGKACDWVVHAFGRLRGAEIERMPGGPAADQVKVSWGWGSEQILLLCHVDTVWPAGTLERRPFRVDGDRAWGPGVYDMKGGILEALWALKALAAADVRLCRRVVIMVTSDEEVGSPSSRATIEAEASKSMCVLVLEPAAGPLGALKTWRKGVGSFRLEIVGRSAHAGVEPEKGVNAIEELACQILELQNMSDPAAGTTVNVGVVGGGMRRNVVPDKAWAEIDIRVKTREEADRVLSRLREIRPHLAGAQVRIAGDITVPPMERGEGTIRLFELARQLASELGFEVEEAGSGGASDGNFTAALGVPTLDGLGMVGDGAHAEHEHIIVSTIPFRTALLARLIAELCKG